MNVLTATISGGLNLETNGILLQNFRKICNFRVEILATVMLTRVFSRSNDTSIAALIVEHERAHTQTHNQSSFFYRRLVDLPMKQINESIGRSISSYRTAHSYYKYYK